MFSETEKGKGVLHYQKKKKKRRWVDWNPLINLKHSCTQVCSTFLEYKDLVESSSIGWVS